MHLDAPHTKPDGVRMLVHLEQGRRVDGLVDEPFELPHGLQCVVPMDLRAGPATLFHPAAKNCLVMPIRGFRTPRFELQVVSGELAQHREVDGEGAALSVLDSNWPRHSHLQLPYPCVWDELSQRSGLLKREPGTSFAKAQGVEW